MIAFGERGSGGPAAIAIVGGGVSGSLLAIQLLQHAARPLRVVMIEPRPSVGPGIAYSTTNPAHLLNVRAGNMSVFERAPDHFLRWLEANAPTPADGDGWRADSFAPRALFGAYVANVLADNGRAAPTAVFRHMRAEAVGVADQDGRLVVRLADGNDLTVDRLALCLGNFPPATPPNLAPIAHSPAFLPDPWDWEALAAIEAGDPVLLLGTGLTMVDTLLELDALGHRGPVLALSRHGLLPKVHARSQARPSITDAATAPRHVRALLRIVRDAAVQAEATGDGWRGVIDGLRADTQTLWRRLEPEERRRFLRHLQPWWDVHRHRIAPRVAAHIGALERSGRLAVHAGRIVRAEDTGDVVTGVWSPRGSGAHRSFRVRWIVNCTGPQCDYSRIREPLVRHLLGLGRARADSLHLGLDVAGDGGVVQHDGIPSDRIFALGPPTRGAFWEITAVPDIRKAAERLAFRMLAPCAESGRAITAPVGHAGPGGGEGWTASLSSSGL
jgi:uncharacterized NAD(P)/FAD-binding protein YdhS